MTIGERKRRRWGRITSSRDKVMREERATGSARVVDITISPDAGIVEDVIYLGEEEEKQRGESKRDPTSRVGTIGHALDAVERVTSVDSATQLTTLTVQV